MKLTLGRMPALADATLGWLAVDGNFQCFTLEDEPRDVKVPGETRIPVGVYPLRLRTFGPTHEKYASKYPEFHRGMLELVGVPGFADVLIHQGNTDDDTAGCILVGNTARAKGTIEDSAKAYQRIYPIIALAVAKSEKVTIEVGL